MQEDSEGSDLYAVPVKRRQRKTEELPPGWEKHEERPPSWIRHLNGNICWEDFVCPPEHKVMPPSCILYMHPQELKKQ